MTGLKYDDGRYLCVEPNPVWNYQVFTDHHKVDECGEVVITQHGSYVDVLFKQANRQFTITPDGKLESRPGGAIGEWEQMQLTIEGGRAILSRAGVSLIAEGYSISTPLRISGIDFVTETGARRVLKGCDQFCAYRQFLDGGMPALYSLLAESHELGFDMWRIFLMGSKRQNSILDLSPHDAGYYEHLRPFADALNGVGIVLLPAVNVDAQDVMPDVGARRDNWLRVWHELAGTQTLLSGGNEYPKNGWNPSELSDLGGMLWSRGSSTGDAAPYRPYGSFAEFHPRRDLPATLMDTVASPVYIHGTNGLTGPLVIDEPLGFAETDQPGRRSNDPRLAYRLARHYATECAGAVFHNDSGMRGQTMSPKIRECAEGWQRGMRL